MQRFRGQKVKHQGKWGGKVSPLIIGAAHTCFRSTFLKTGSMQFYFGWKILAVIDLVA